MKIQPGDIFESLSNQHHPNDGPVRIKVLATPASTLGFCGPWMVKVATITRDGREIRRRDVDIAKLYESRTKDDGTLRRTGFVRVTGSAAGAITAKLEES